MQDKQTVQVTPADIQSAGEKLEAFRQELPPAEQAALAWLFQRATMSAAEESPAAGFAIVFNRDPDAAGDGLPFRFETTWSLGPGSAGEAKP